MQDSQNVYSFFSVFSANIEKSSPEVHQPPFLCTYAHNSGFGIELLGN